MKVEEAYQLLRKPDECSLAVRLECHQAKLRSYHGVGDWALQAIIAEALADVCAGVQLLLGERAE